MSRPRSDASLRTRRPLSSRRTKFHSSKRFPSSPPPPNTPRTPSAPSPTLSSSNRASDGSRQVRLSYLPSIPTHTQYPLQATATPPECSCTPPFLPPRNPAIRTQNSPRESQEFIPSLLVTMSQRTLWLPRLTRSIVAAGVLSRMSQIAVREVLQNEAMLVHSRSHWDSVRATACLSHVSLCMMSCLTLVVPQSRAKAGSKRRSLSSQECHSTSMLTPPSPLVYHAEESLRCVAQSQTATSGMDSQSFGKLSQREPRTTFSACCA